MSVVEDDEHAKLLMETNIAQEISILSIALKMFLIVTIPVIVGMFFRKFFSNIAISFETTAKKISTVLFALVLIGAILSERENIISYFSQAGLITLVLNVLMMIIAFYLAKFFATGNEQKRCTFYKFC